MPARAWACRPAYLCADAGSHPFEHPLADADRHADSRPNRHADGHADKHVYGDADPLPNPV
jgi:hypothetical protein